MSEASVVKSIVDYIKKIGGAVIKTHGDAYSVVGTPDLLACILGDFWAIEVKDGDNTPSKAQRYQLKLWRNAGAHTLVAWSMGDLKSALKQSYPEKEW